MKPLMLCRIVLGLLAIMLPPFSHSQPMTPNAAATSPAAVADPPLDIVLVLDNSGSMKQNDPQRLTREVVTRFLEGIRANTRLGMVIFDQDARLIEPLTTLDSLNAKIRFLKGLDSLNYQGRYTNTAQPLLNAPCTNCETMGGSRPARSSSSSRTGSSIPATAPATGKRNSGSRTASRPKAGSLASASLPSLLPTAPITRSSRPWP